MVYDKIKASFSPSWARHVLSLEASQSHKDMSLGRLALTESLDAYRANLGDKPYGVKPIKPGAKFENRKRISPSHFPPLMW